MNQGVITNTKRLYKIHLLRRILLFSQNQEASQFLKEFNLRDCFSLLSLSWESVNSSILQKAWKPLLGDLFLLNSDSAVIQDPLSNTDANLNDQKSSTDLLNFSQENLNKISELLSGPDYSAEKSREFLLKWIEIDSEDNDCGWESLSDNDIVHFVTNSKCEPKIINECKEIQTVSGNLDSVKISPSEVLECLNKIKIWIKSKENVSPVHLALIEELENNITQETS